MRRMKNKLFGVIFLFVIIGFTIYGSIHLYSRLKSDEKMKVADISGFLPTDFQYLLTIYNPKQIQTEYHNLEKISKLLPNPDILLVAEAIGKEQICSQQNSKDGLIISFYPEGELLFSKMKKENFRLMEKNFFSENLSEFSAKKEIYKDVTIYIKVTQKEDFFCYAWCDFVFFGSFDKSLIYKAIDFYCNNKKSTNKSELNSLFLDKYAFAGLTINSSQIEKFDGRDFEKYKGENIGGNIRFKDGIMEFSGYITLENSKDTSDTNFEKINFAPEMIPESVSFFRCSSLKKIVENHGDSFFSADSSMISIIKEATYCKFTKNNSLLTTGNIIFFKSPYLTSDYQQLLLEKKLLKKMQTEQNFILSHNNYFFIARDEISVKDYITQIESRQTFDNKKNAQPILQKFKSNDICNMFYIQKKSSEETIFDCFYFFDCNKEQNFHVCVTELNSR